MTHNIGAQNPNAVLTAANVRRILCAAIKARFNGRLPHGWLTAQAAKYGTSAGNIHDILSGRRWAHVTEKASKKGSSK